MKIFDLKSHRVALIATTFIVTLLTGCKGDVLDYRNVQIVNGRVFAGDANTPFSGKVTNVPVSGILNNQTGYQQMMQSSAYVVPEAYRGGISSMAIHQFLCDTKVTDGVLDGDVVCKAPQSDTVRMKMSFSNAALTGSMQIFDNTGDRTVLDVNFSNGKPDGTEKVYYAPTKQLIGEFPWKHGSLDGTVKTYDGKTGNRLLEARYENGTANGEMVRYAPDGKRVIYRASFANNELDGAEDRFDPDTGELVSHSVWQMGVRVPTPEEAQATANTLATLERTKQVKACVRDLRNATPPDPMDVTGQQEAKRSAECEQRFPAVANVPVTPTPPSSTGTEDRSAWPTEDNACTQKWQKNFVAKNGPDAIIRYDMAWEWVDNCRAGKQPS
ncbi:toxin-antitoxin system YwqK family antitoxin [Burkholderia cepacia]|uniref:toxin-antitoxin system YwqK family antitoxin n=1 Tax=Burkholderia cepacia TaxID=292 RepID=UPI0012970DC6|nr:toxin-antitoxin system YwqK family antitoxin [Burkholderia cepacia]QFS37632.1 Antitoxin component YwqK of the YwqJK toxin-antitoxin modul [Burkholderia cepacia]